MVEGLYHKYNIAKVDGSPVDPKAVYFILRLDTDRAARVAAWTYAGEIVESNPLLAFALLRKVKQLGGLDEA